MTDKLQLTDSLINNKDKFLLHPAQLRPEYGIHKLRETRCDVVEREPDNVVNTVSLPCPAPYQATMVA